MKEKGVRKEGRKDVKERRRKEERGGKEGRMPRYEQRKEGREDSQRVGVH